MLCCPELRLLGSTPDAEWYCCCCELLPPCSALDWCPIGAMFLNSLFLDLFMLWWSEAIKCISLASFKPF